MCGGVLAALLAVSILALQKPPPSEDELINIAAQFSQKIGRELGVAGHPLNVDCRLITPERSEREGSVRAIALCKLSYRTGPLYKEVAISDFGNVVYSASTGYER